MSKFANFIHTLLVQFGVSESALKILTTKEAILAYEMAFTQMEQACIPDTGTIDRPANGTYQSYEQIGDAIIKVFMVSYFYKRFPKLWRNSCGVKIVARLVIKYGSREVLSSFSTQYGFEPYIKTNIETSLGQRRLSLLEDVFEAFIGVTSIIIDSSVGKWGAGNIVAYGILETIYDHLDIPLDYEHLFDSKTRLKELCDLFKEKLGEVVYIATKTDAVIKVIIEWRLDGKRRIIGQGIDTLKIKAEQTAASQALKQLQIYGFEKKIQREYLELI